ncbi:DUF298-domain-containing protein, partial [Ceraceosorus guamensis]
SSKTTKEAAIRQLRQITNATQPDAQRLLKANGYRIEAAVDAFYADDAAMSNAAKAAGGGVKGEKESKEKLGKLFDQYKDTCREAHSSDQRALLTPRLLLHADEDGPDVSIEGAMSMCEDLSLSPEDAVMLPLSFYLRSPSMGHYTRDAYIEGWRTLDGADTVAKQKQLLPKLREELEKDAEVRGALASEGKGGLFARVYDWVYAYARDEGQKSLKLDTAIAFWRLLLPISPSYAREGSSGRFTARQLDLWEKYLTNETGGRAISKDTWTLFLDFTKEIDADFKEHDFDAAWPSVIDDFVTWALDQPKSDAMDTS